MSRGEIPTWRSLKKAVHHNQWLQESLKFEKAFPEEKIMQTVNQTWDYSIKLKFAYNSNVDYTHIFCKTKSYRIAICGYTRALKAANSIWNWKTPSLKKYNEKTWMKLQRV